MNTGGSVKGFSLLLKNCINHCFNPQFLSVSSTLPRVIINSGDEFADKWHVDSNFSYLVNPGAGLPISSAEVFTVDTSSFYGGIKAVIGNILDPSFAVKSHSVWQKIPKDLCVGQVVTFSCDVLTSLPNVKIGIFKRKISGGVLTEFTDVRGSYNHIGDGRSHRLWVTASLLPNDVNFGELVIYISCGGFTPYKLTGGLLTLFEAGNCSFVVGGYDVLPYIESRDKHSDEVMNDSTVVGRTVKDALNVCPSTIGEFYNASVLVTGLLYSVTCSVNGKKIFYPGINPNTVVRLEISNIVGSVDGSGTLSLPSAIIPVGFRPLASNRARFSIVGEVGGGIPGANLPASMEIDSSGNLGFAVLKAGVLSFSGWPTGTGVDGINISPLCVEYPII